MTNKEIIIDLLCNGHSCNDCRNKNKKCSGQICEQWEELRFPHITWGQIEHVYTKEAEENLIYLASQELKQMLD